MIMTLLGSALGFAGSVVPEVLGYFKQKQANEQELAMLEAKAKYAQTLSELKIAELDQQADIAETKAIYAHDQNLDSGKFINALRGSVRPIITYVFIGLYTGIKVTTLVTMVTTEGMDLSAGMLAIWTETDQVAMSAILSFWFGNRAMTKAREYYGKTNSK